MSISGVGGFVFREPEGEKLLETDNVASAPTNANEVKMDIRKVYGAKDTSRPLYSLNTPI